METHFNDFSVTIILMVFHNYTLYITGNLLIFLNAITQYILDKSLLNILKKSKKYKSH